METVMDAHSVAVISRDGWGRQRCYSVPAVRHEGKNKTGLNLETYRSVGKRWDDSQRENGEAWKLRIRWAGKHWDKTGTLRAERKTIRMKRWQRWVGVWSIAISSHKWSRSKMSLGHPFLSPPPLTAHLHLPPPHQTQHRLTELSASPEAMWWLCQTPLWAKLSNFSGTY